MYLPSVVWVFWTVSDVCYEVSDATNCRLQRMSSSATVINWDPYELYTGLTWEYCPIWTPYGHVGRDRGRGIDVGLLLGVGVCVSPAPSPVIALLLWRIPDERKQSAGLSPSSVSIQRRCIDEVHLERGVLSTVNGFAFVNVHLSSAMQNLSAEINRPILVYLMRIIQFTNKSIQYSSSRIPTLFAKSCSSAQNSNRTMSRSDLFPVWLFVMCWTADAVSVNANSAWQQPRCVSSHTGWQTAP